jgi:uncharacterized Zn finger protein (UPF0148 family)
MEKRCDKCGSPVGAEQAFCPACGAVIGMNLGTTQAGGGWDLASTVVGQHSSTPPQRSTAERRAHQTRPEAPKPQPAPAPRKGSNTVLLAVIGFVAVLIIGGLVILLLLNSQR